ncbi:unnamed protein product [Cercopithifilaria johnstoni]|uniref:Paired domain-containing protein n=1 Tax=Cercopithifilaria johnstoni TaxID=2874296 RepID=A0A8J2M1P1_9BILA|nr:unnamed protein product [Cercopithifilaria johnstoni]
MALEQNMVGFSAALNHEIQIHSTQVDYTSLLLTKEYNNAYYFMPALACSAYYFKPALSCIVPTEVQRYILPYTLPPTSYIINSSRQQESMKKKEIQGSISPCKLIATTPSHAASFSKNKLGRQYNPGRPLAMEERQKILQLYEKGHRVSHIARIIGVTHSCVSKIMTRYRRTGSMQPRSTRFAAKKNINHNSDMNIDPVLDNNHQKLCRRYTVDSTLSATSQPVKSYLIQRYIYFN